MQNHTKHYFQGVITMSGIKQENEIIKQTVDPLEKAIKQLIGEGLTKEKAENIVRTNFECINNNNQLIITVDELVKLNEIQCE